ncbi:hypothetical protein BU23DRAFT_563334 [Bimuria novae-zelandiae CBS 107.79]|uniref:Uncharacterized protein n=1 Tax=Bimuria novae-zelandiae CBS 107.79 TaxID=1447943 RepID=A0A6A5VW42_9PLEO|nr:hypothetical protein BU23DRAFT_563334 [Bimuria novae-zelandiae CBS 107.79]
MRLLRLITFLFLVALAAAVMGHATEDPVDAAQTASQTVEVGTASQPTPWYNFLLNMRGATIETATTTETVTTTKTAGVTIIKAIATTATMAKYTATTNTVKKAANNRYPCQPCIGFVETCAGKFSTVVEVCTLGRGS